MKVFRLVTVTSGIIAGLVGIIAAGFIHNWLVMVWAASSTLWALWVMWLTITKQD